MRGNPLFGKSRFPRTLSGKNFYVASGKDGVWGRGGPMCPPKKR